MIAFDVKSAGFHLISELIEVLLNCGGLSQLSPKSRSQPILDFRQQLVFHTGIFQSNDGFPKNHSQFPVILAEGVKTLCRYPIDVFRPTSGL